MVDHHYYCYSYPWRYRGNCIYSKSFLIKLLKNESELWKIFRVFGSEMLDMGAEDQTVIMILQNQSTSISSDIIILHQAIFKSYFSIIRTLTVFIFLLLVISFFISIWLSVTCIVIYIVLALKPLASEGVGSYTRSVCSLAFFIAHCQLHDPENCEAACNISPELRPLYNILSTIKESS